MLRKRRLRHPRSAARKGPHFKSRRYRDLAISAFQYARRAVSDQQRQLLTHSGNAKQLVSQLKKGNKWVDEKCFIQDCRKAAQSFGEPAKKWLFICQRFFLGELPTRPGQKISA